MCYFIMSLRPISELSSKDLQFYATENEKEKKNAYAPPLPLLFFRMIKNVAGL